MLNKYLFVAAVVGVLICVNMFSTSQSSVLPMPSPNPSDLAIVNPAPPSLNDANIVSVGPNFSGASMYEPTWTMQTQQPQPYYYQSGNCSHRCGGGYGIYGNRCRPFWCRGPLRRLISFPFRRHRCW